MITFENFLEAARIGNLELVNKYIKEHVNNVDAINQQFDAGYPADGKWCLEDGDTALICAVRAGQLAIVQALLAVEGIDIDKRNNAEQ